MVQMLTSEERKARKRQEKVNYMRKVVSRYGELIGHGMRASDAAVGTCNEFNISTPTFYAYRAAVRKIDESEE